MNQTTWIKTMTQERPWSQPWVLPETAQAWYTNPSRLETLAEGFDPISLREMDSVALLNRIDTKFVMTNAQMLNALAAVRQDYRILMVHGQRLNHYRTLYFDTPNFDLYHLHVNGRADRYKVRSREYTDSHLSFLEVKHKTPKDRTIKDRIPTAQTVVKINRDSVNWLHGVFPYDSRKLQPKLWNTFTRITLVSKQHCERVTLDVDLTFYAANKVVRLDGIAIAEVKMDSGNRASPFLAQMHAQRIHPQGFSKYCIGVSMLYEQVKKNTLKPQILWLEKMTEGVYRE